MAWDLAVDHSGDLVFGPNRDLASTTDMDLLEQRIRIRLVMPQGTAVYDVDQTIGSEIALVLRKPMDSRNYDAMALRIQEALATMEDIIVTNVELFPGEQGVVSVTVTYRPVVDEEDVFMENATDQILQIQF